MARNAAPDTIVELFSRIRADYPQLHMSLQLHHPHVDLLVECPPQAGMRFPLSINLQGDELHLNVGEVFWVEWFPCDRPVVRAEFEAAVRGLLSGEYRVVEFLRDGRPIKAELQRPSGTGWECVCTSATMHFPWPRLTETRILQNS